MARQLVGASNILFPLAGNWSIQVKGSRDVRAKMRARPAALYPINDMMVGLHGMEPPAIAAAYDFSAFQTIADVTRWLRSARLGAHRILGTLLR